MHLADGKTMQIIDEKKNSSSKTICRAQFHYCASSVAFISVAALDDIHTRTHFAFSLSIWHSAVPIYAIQFNSIQFQILKRHKKKKHFLWGLFLLLPYSIKAFAKSF